MVDELILVRHGETVHNVAGVAQGWNDSDLSDRGKRQVQRLAERIALMEIDAIFSSSLQRALTTAQAISDLTSLPLQAADDLREMSYGKWEGCSFLEVRRDHESAYRRWASDSSAPCPGGESHDDVRTRIENFLSRIHVISSAGAAPQGHGSNGDSLPRRPLIVAHGTAIRIAATVLLGLPVSTASRFAQDNASINVFVRRGERFVLKVWNDTTHCGD